MNRERDDRLRQTGFDRVVESGLSVGMKPEYDMAWAYAKPWFSKIVVDGDHWYWVEDVESGREEPKPDPGAWIVYQPKVWDDKSHVSARMLLSKCAVGSGMEIPFKSNKPAMLPVCGKWWCLRPSHLDDVGRKESRRRSRMITGWREDDVAVATGPIWCSRQAMGMMGLGMPSKMNLEEFDKLAESADAEYARYAGHYLLKHGQFSELARQAVQQRRWKDLRDLSPFPGVFVDAWKRPIAVIRDAGALPLLSTPNGRGV